MRDILTVFASVVILILAAALVAPPLIDWEARRPAIDRLISRATGTVARTEGRIDVRLLPSPRLRVDGLRLGSGATDAPSLMAQKVKAELALTPLLRGEVRFTDMMVGRAEIRVSATTEGAWQVRPDLLVGAGRFREWAVENLLVNQLLLTAQVPATGRTDQVYAESVRIEGQKLAGPWRVEGTTGGVPFRIVTGEMAPDHTVQAKVSGGGDAYPRFDVDAKIGLTAGAAPSVAGSARLLFGPPGQVASGIPVPVTVQASFKANGGEVEVDPVSIEAGEGGASVRLTGSGSLSLDAPRLALKLEGRRLDADAFLLSANGQDVLAKLSGWFPPPLPMPVDLDLSLTSIGLAQDELSNVVLRASLAQGRLRAEQFQFSAPGDTRVVLAGEVGLTAPGSARGRVEITSGLSDRLARYLERLGLSGPLLAALDGRPVEAAGDVVLATPVASFRDVRLRAGDAILTGNARYSAPEAGARGRLEAQAVVQGLDLARLPQVSSIFDATQRLDVGFTLLARDVRYGSQRGAGRITARIASDGPALLVETLDITDLAGANARVSGRIAPDGSGRIAGRVTAQRAAPLVDLIGSVWIGGVSKLVPHFLREGELDVEVATERAKTDQDQAELKLQTSVRGTAAGGRFEADVVTKDGVTDSLTVRLATDNTGRWVDRPEVAILRRPSTVDLRGVRVGSGQFNATISGDLGGVRVSTARPFTLSPDDDVVDSGEATVMAEDVTPFLALLGDGAGVKPPVPIELRVTLGRERDASLVAVSGRVAGEGIQARLSARSRADVSGTVTLERLSLPWLATALTLNAPADPHATTLWSTAPFGQSGRLFSGGSASFKVGRLDLGRGLEGENAGFKLEITPEGLALRDLALNLAGGQLAGSAAITRQGAVASVVGEGTIRDASLNLLIGASPFDGRLSTSLKFGTSGENMAGLVANLAGSGTLRLARLQVDNASPTAASRAVTRLLGDNDPLAPGRAEGAALEELDRRAFRAEAVSAPTTLIGGVLRMSPVVAEAEDATWQGTVTFDLKTLVLDARGSLTAKTAPKGWTGPLPTLGLAWHGPLAEPSREIEVGPLANSLAAIVLQRELEKIEGFEADANERQRRLQRREMDRQRERDRQAAEEAAARHALAERIRLEAERTRAEAERARAEADLRARATPEPKTPSPAALPSLPPPIDIRPPPQVQGAPAPRPTPRPPVAVSPRPVETPGLQ